LNNIENKIKQLICKLKNIDNFDENTSLIDSGFLDSFTIMHFLSEIENEFDIILPPESLNPEDFDTIKTVANLIEKLKA
jgi:D-alanine--poly(phosphoribitol) ligase subunit 2